MLPEILKLQKFYRNISLYSPLAPNPVSLHQEVSIRDFPGSPVGFSQWLRDKSICLPRKRPGFIPWVRKRTCTRECLSTPVFLPGEFHGQRKLRGDTIYGIRKELDTIEQLTLPFTFVVQWLRFLDSSAGGMGSIPDQGIRIPQASECSQNV